MRRAGGAVQGAASPTHPARGAEGEWADMPVAAFARRMTHRLPYT